MDRKVSDGLTGWHYVGHNLSVMKLRGLYRADYAKVMECQNG